MDFGRNDAAFPLGVSPGTCKVAVGFDMRNSLPNVASLSSHDVAAPCSYTLTSKSHVPRSHSFAVLTGV